MLLIAYDGSDGAQDAIDHAARIAPGADVVVLTAWEPYADALARIGVVGLGGIPSDVGESNGIDDDLRGHAEQTASEGAARASAAGLRATPRTEPMHGSAAPTILDVAGELDADAIVVGSRGRGALKSAVLGSVSHKVLHHATRPVLITPSPDAD